MYLYEASENTTTAFLIWWKSVNKFGAPKTRLCVFNCALGSSAEGIFLYFFLIVIFYQKIKLYILYEECQTYFTLILAGQDQ